MKGKREKGMKDRYSERKEINKRRHEIDEGMKWVKGKTTKRRRKEWQKRKKGRKDKSEESEGNDQFLKSLDYYLNNFTENNESALDYLNSKSLKLSQLLENSQKRKQAWKNED